EVLRRGVRQTPATTAPDAGAAAPAVPPHVGVLVDNAGTVAFATPDGYVGAVTPASGAVETLGDPMCLRGAGLRGPSPSPPPTGAAFAGLAPAGPNAFIVACETGTVTKITSESAAPP